MKKIWPYSPQYESIIGEGFNRPHPRFGAPTLVWHIAIWQNLSSDEVDLTSIGEGLEREGVSKYKKNRKTEFRAHDIQSAKLYEELNKLITALQNRGCQADNHFEELKYVAPAFMPGSEVHERIEGLKTYSDLYKFRVSDPQSVEFTLWWQDGHQDGMNNVQQAEPQAEDIRVNVQLQTFVDHITMTFYIDVSKPWGQEPIYSSRAAVGERRQKIFRYLKLIRASAKRQVAGGHVDQDLLPETGVDKEEAEQLLEAADYLYEDVWGEFLTSFGLRDNPVIASRDDGFEGRRFADFRGLIAAVDDFERNQDNRWAPTSGLSDWGGAEPAEEAFDPEKGEPNRVLKAHWPFFRRAIPWADYRDIVGCGLINFRALYLTSQRSSGMFNDKEESRGREHDVPAGSLSRQEEKQLSDKRPIRYMILTKGKPHREQIGRFVERMNHINTIRMFALKSWPAVRNAGSHIRLLGRELDEILAFWNQERQKIEETWELKDQELRDARLNALSVSRLFGFAGSGRSKDGFDDEYEDIPSKATLENNDRRVRRLSKLISTVENRVLSIGESLDKVGHGGSGRLLYVIRRSELFIREFYEMKDSLQMKDIKNWINYDQFILRGLKPTFDQIMFVGNRLISLRKRLEVITQTIQTSALIIETEATRANTETLRKVARNSQLLNGIVGAGLVTSVAGFLIYSGNSLWSSALWLLEKLIDLWGVVSSLVQAFSG